MLCSIHSEHGRVSSQHRSCRSQLSHLSENSAAPCGLADRVRGGASSRPKSRDLMVSMPWMSGAVADIGVVAISFPVAG
jgi:hypothetical protein